jgi:Xaa-Pro aminopeptidase
MRYFPLRPELFTENRQRFTAAMEVGQAEIGRAPKAEGLDRSDGEGRQGADGRGGIAIFVSNDEVTSNADAHYPYRQNSDLFWLSGIWQEDTTLVLFPGHPDACWC